MSDLAEPKTEIEPRNVPIGQFLVPEILAQKLKAEPRQSELIARLLEQHYALSDGAIVVTVGKSQYHFTDADALALVKSLTGQLEKKQAEA